MSAEGVRALMEKHSASGYQLVMFDNKEAFYAAQDEAPFYAVIFSLPGTREHRRECLAFFNDVAKNHPLMKRLVMANNESEARLISQLSLTPLHGILNKAEPLNFFADSLLLALSESSKSIDSVGKTSPMKTMPRLLSPTERTILRYLTDGYSVSQIASHLERNIKTIRAHKFNAMLKLGVHTDAGLLNAADMLLHRASLF